MFHFRNKHCHAIWPISNRQMYYYSNQHRNRGGNNKIKKCIKCSLKLNINAI